MCGACMRGRVGQSTLTFRLERIFECTSMLCACVERVCMCCVHVWKIRAVRDLAGREPMEL